MKIAGEAIETDIKKDAFSKIKKVIGENCACYVLITCTQPAKDGKMQVEMNYEGDECLAAFLVENASQVFDGRQQKSK